MATRGRLGEPVITSRVQAERIMVGHIENLIGSCGQCYANTGMLTPAPCPSRRAAWRYLDSLGLTP